MDADIEERYGMYQYICLHTLNNITPLAKLQFPVVHDQPIVLGTLSQSPVRSFNSQSLFSVLALYFQHSTKENALETC